jgi:hypothetical protein
MFGPPSDTAAEPADESAFPLSLFTTVDFPPPAIPNDSSSLGLAVAVEFDVELGEDAPPVAVDVAVLVEFPPLPPLLELSFWPAPPAPPVRLTDTVLVAELDCVSVLEVVLVLLPVFDPDDEFDWLVLPCVGLSSPSAPATKASASTATAARNVVCSLLT